MEISKGYVVIKALQNGVNITELTTVEPIKADSETLRHTETLMDGEVYISLFTPQKSAIKIQGRTKIYSEHGMVDSAQ